MIKRLFIVIFLSLIIFTSCYSYVPNLKNLSPEEVVFEFNRILNRIDEIEYLKGILTITTGYAYEDAKKLINLITLYKSGSKNINVVKEEIELLIEYYSRIKIVVIERSNIQNSDNEYILKVSYYDNKTQISDIKNIYLIKKADIWKISEIIDVK
jgi:hypothetical protein